MAMPDFSTEADHADHEALRALKAVFEKAVRENQLDLLKAYLDERFSIVSFTNREFSEFEAFKAQWQKTREQLLQGGTYSVELLPEHSLLYGDLALARGDSRNVMTTGAGTKYEFGSRWTVLCRKVGGEWKILRAHSSISPFDNPMLLAGVKKKVVQIAVGALVAGLAIGGLAAGLIVAMMHR